MRWVDLAKIVLMSPFGVVLALFAALGVWAAADATRHSATAAPSEWTTTSRVATSTEAGGGVPASAPLNTDPAALWLDSDPAGASVWIDGDSLGPTPALARAVAAGAVWVSFRSARGQVDTVVTVAAGEARRLAVALPGARRLAPTDARRPAEVRPAPVRDDRREEPVAVRADAPPAVAERPGVRPAEPLPASLRVTSDPAGADVTVDGRVVGQTPLVVRDLAPGPHAVAVAALGFETERTRPVLAAGREGSVAFDLTSRSGFLEIDAPPGSTVAVDGQTRVVASGAAYRTAVPPGMHQVVVTSPESGETVQDVEVRAGVTFRVTVRPRRRP